MDTDSVFAQRTDPSLFREGAPRLYEEYFPGCQKVQTKAGPLEEEYLDSSFSNTGIGPTESNIGTIEIRRTGGSKKSVTLV